MQLTNTSFREFSLNDYDAFAGAENFSDGSVPVIAELEDSQGYGFCTIVFSGSGLDILSGCDECTSVYVLPISEQLAKFVIDRATTEEMSHIGFWESLGAVEVGTC